MSDIEELTKELRKFVTMQKRMQFWSLAIAIPLIVIVIILAILDATNTGPFRHNPDPPSWHSVGKEIEQGQYDQALTHGKVLLEKTPNDDYAHSYLASVYQAKGDLSNAEKEYETAYKLWPTEKNEKNLKAIRKRIEAEQTKKP